MWLLCLEVVRGHPSLGLGSVALLIFVNSLGRCPVLSAQAIPMMLATIACVILACIGMV